MNQSWTICSTTYLHWIGSSKMLVLCLVFIFLYNYCIEPMQYYASVLETPLNMLEPFISIMNSLYTAPLIPILFLFLISDYPKLDQSSSFILLRTGRRSWFWGQITFIALAALTYLFIILVFSVAIVASEAFWANGWSLAVREIYAPKYADLFTQSGLSQIDLSVLNQSRPFQAAITCFILMWGYMIVTGAILLLFALNGKKLVGIFLNVTANALGLLMLAVDTPLKWVLPSAHTVFAWHYDATYHNTYLDIRISYFYDAFLLILMLCLAWQSTKGCSFHTIETTE